MYEGDSSYLLQEFYISLCLSIYWRVHPLVWRPVANIRYHAVTRQIVNVYIPLFPFWFITFISSCIPYDNFWIMFLRYFSILLYWTRHCRLRLSDISVCMRRRYCRGASEWMTACRAMQHKLVIVDVPFHSISFHDDDQVLMQGTPFILRINVHVNYSPKVTVPIKFVSIYGDSIKSFSPIFTHVSSDEFQRECDSFYLTLVETIKQLYIIFIFCKSKYECTKRLKKERGRNKEEIIKFRTPIQVDPC